MSNAYVDPWDMLNNFCFDVYAQMLLFMDENVNGFFDCEWTNHRAGSQLKTIFEVGIMTYRSEFSVQNSILGRNLGYNHLLTTGLILDHSDHELCLCSSPVSRDSCSSFGSN